ATTDPQLPQPLAFIHNSTPPLLPPQHTYLLIPPIKTLPLPIQHLQPNTLPIIHILQQHSPLKHVFHPTISHHLNHHIHQPQSQGHTPLVPFEVPDI
ncbi:PLP-dependent transferase, partial [Staphylococcus saprophyticus]|uniref:PLP-dependent transferase n=1 Tax=Staphylococcus saprophyticus TaxID=29385 RepID=UPI001643656E